MSPNVWPAFVFSRRYLRHIVIGVVAVCLSVAAGHAEQPMPVTVFMAKQNAVTERISVVGTLAAREEVEVHPSIPGKEIQHILMEAGQRVEAGQPLVLLDTADALLALDKNDVSAMRAEAAVAVENSKVEVAQVTEREAAKRLERSRALQPKGAVSDQVLEEHHNAYERAVAELGLARQSLILAQADAQLIARERNEIELTIERSTLRAPVSGTILERSARVGAMTTNSGDPLFRIARDGTIEFVAEVTDTNFVRLREGMRAAVTLAGRDRPVVGTVRLNAAQLDAKTRSGTVRIALDESESLTPGIFARGVIEAAIRTNVLLPGTAVKSARGAYSVYVVSNDVVEIRDVTIGAQQDNFVEIIDGVREGEMIVLKAGGFLKERQHVTPVTALVGSSPDVAPPEAISLMQTGEVVRR